MYHAHLPSSVCADRQLRPYHTSLNRSITARLPLCLPPHARDAQLYYRGISLFAVIYIAFERQWMNVLEHLEGRNRDDRRISDILKRLYIPSLQRSERLQADLNKLRRRWPCISSSQPTMSLPIAEQIAESIRDKPHNLIAYSWIMYMALFNGGRWIRTQLQSAGPEFWGMAHVDSGIDCLSFWDFDGTEDGEDIKRDFKQRIEEITGLLSNEEREDIVQEAVRIFQLCQSLVDHLDETVGSNDAGSLIPESAEDAPPTTPSSGLWNWDWDWDWIWRLERLWPSKLWGNDFWLRSEVRVQP